VLAEANIKNGFAYSIVKLLRTGHSLTCKTFHETWIAQERGGQTSTRARSRVQHTTLPETASVYAYLTASAPQPGATAQCMALCATYE